MNFLKQLIFSVFQLISIINFRISINFDRFKVWQQEIYTFILLQMLYYSNKYLMVNHIVDFLFLKFIKIYFWYILGREKKSIIKTIYSEFLNCFLNI